MTRDGIKRRNRLAERLDRSLDALDEGAVLHRDVVPASLLARVLGGLSRVASLRVAASDRAIGLAELGLGALDAAALDAITLFAHEALAGGIVVVPTSVAELEALDAPELAFVELRIPERRSARLYLAADALAPRGERRRRHGALPLVVSLVSGWTRLRLAELRALEQGDVILLDRAPSADAHGLVDGLDARLALRRVDDAWIVGPPGGALEEDGMEDQDGDALVAVDDARVVLSVEIARIEARVGELEALAVGSVLASDVPTTRAVVLRLGGRGIARGELVEVDGATAVRITALRDPQ